MNEYMKWASELTSKTVEPKKELVAEKTQWTLKKECRINYDPTFKQVRMTFNLPFEIDATSKKVSDFLLAKESWDHKSEFKGTHCVIIDNQCVPLLVVAFSATSNEMMLEAISSLVEMTETDACVELTDIAAKFIQATKEELFLSQNPPETDENLSDDEAREAFLALSKVMAPEDFNEFTEKIFEPKPLKEVSVPSIYAIPPEVEANYLSKGIRLIPTPPGQ